MKRIMLFFAFASLAFVACQQGNSISKEFPKVIEVSLKNNSSQNLEDAIIQIPIEQLLKIDKSFNPNACVAVANGQECASQISDVDGDDIDDFLVVNVDLTKVQSLEVRFNPEGVNQREYIKRTQAELSCKTGGYFEDRKYIGGTFQNIDFLRVPDEHTDHSFYIRYEGPGWESDLVGYRFYLDWRNAIDIFGKKTNTMVLQDVGQDGFDSYHEPADWGQDILKVGESLGIGTLGIWLGDKAQRVAITDSIECWITVNGPVQSVIKTQYHGWEIKNKKYNLTSYLSISAGSRMTKHHVEISPVPENLCTGIVKDKNARLLKSMNQDSEWQYLATYGLQSLANDTLGMAVLYRSNDLIELTDDKESNVIVLKTHGGELDYYFLAVWQQETPMSEEEFIGYLNDEIDALNNPVSISIQ